MIILLLLLVVVVVVVVVVLGREPLAIPVLEGVQGKIVHTRNLKSEIVLESAAENPRRFLRCRFLVCDLLTLGIFLMLYTLELFARFFAFTPQIALKSNWVRFDALMAVGRGQMGSALTGSLQISCFLTEGLFGYQSVKICPTLSILRTAPLICQNSLLSQRPHLHIISLLFLLLLLVLLL